MKQIGRPLTKALALTAAPPPVSLDGDIEPVLMPPVVWHSPLLLPAGVWSGRVQALVLASYAPPRYGDPVPGEMTAYCLTRTQTRRVPLRSRRDRGPPIPSFSPLALDIELYEGRRYLGAS